MKKLTILLLMLPGFISMGYSQDNLIEFKPNGKSLALIFSNFHTSFSGGEAMPAFGITRAYLGYEYNFSKEWYGKVVLDVADPGSGKLQMTAFLKNAYIKYNRGNFTAYFGMISTTQFKVSEKIWGYRYIEKTFQDAYKFNSSADLGINLDYKINAFLSADFSIINGEGYKKLQGDNILRPGIGVTVKPVENVTARIFTDYMGNKIKQKSVATFLAYSGKTITLGVAYNYQKNVAMVKSEDMYGISIYTTYKPSDKIKIFGRFDDLQSNIKNGENAPWHLNEDGQLMVLGFEVSPIKGVKFAPNFRGWNPADKSEKFISSLYLNCELKF
jgi:hypothetical protein